MKMFVQLLVALVILTGCGGSDNQLPVADAGIDQNVHTTSTVILDGSSSTDSNSKTLTYSWEVVSIPTDSNAILSDTTSVNPSFIADIDGTYTFNLIVNNGSDDSIVDTITVTAATENSVPVANAGVDQNLYIVASTSYSVTLDASGSSDADLDSLIYAWSVTSKPTDSTATFIDATAVAPTLEVDTFGTYVIELIVNDTQVDSIADTVTITLSENLVPVATAQSLSTIENTDLNITLTGTDENEGDTLTYSVLSTPSNGSLSGTAPNLVYTPNTDFNGTDSFTFKVNDAVSDSATKTISITVTNLSITHKSITYDTITSPYTGKVWLDRNLGASQICTALDDTACYGDYYQWGRDADGHEKSDSSITTTAATDVDNAGSSFITLTQWASVDSDGSLRSANWSKTDGTSVCPVGYRVPTIAEVQSETTNNGVSNVANMTDGYNNFLKLPAGGYRHNTTGDMTSVGSYSVIWASDPVGTEFAKTLDLEPSASSIQDSQRGYGLNVRCIKD